MAQCHLRIRTARQWEIECLHPVAFHAGRQRPGSRGLTTHEFANIYTFGAQRPAQMLHQHEEKLGAYRLRHLPDDLEEASPLGADLLQ
jgi:hypothetical protein